MPRRSVGATVQWTESSAAAHPFEGAVIVQDPLNATGYTIAADGEPAAEIVRDPLNSTGFTLTADPEADPDALVLMSTTGGAFLLPL